MSTELVRAEAVEIAGYNLGSLQVSRPKDVIAVATEVATPLAKLIDEKKLFKIITGKKFVYVEGWSTMGAMLGVVPRHVPELSKRHDDGEYEEAVELVRVSDGMVIGRAAAVCGGDSDKVWKSRPEYARKSMAITRATGKAFRLAFSWIMTLAGYQPTPAEEMDGAEDDLKNDKPKTKPSGNGHDKDAEAFRDKFAKVYAWFKDHHAEKVVLDTLGAAGYEKASEIPADKRDGFLRSLELVKVDVQRKQADKEGATATLDATTAPAEGPDAVDPELGF